MKRVYGMIGIVMCLITPIATILCFAGLVDLQIYYWLWLGFYGSILVCLLYEKPVKYLLVLPNAAVILFCGFVSLMGGVSGLLLFFRVVLIPFYFIFF